MIKLPYFDYKQERLLFFIYNEYTTTGNTDTFTKFRAFFRAIIDDIPPPPFYISPILTAH
jgi:hypothetical protein